jgi:hypothetical protein
MALARGPRGGILALVGLALALCAALLGAAGWLLSSERGEEPEPSVSLEERVQAIDVVRAADRLSLELEALRGELGFALMPGEEENLARLLRLQAESSEVALGTVRFEPQEREGMLQVVSLELEVQGAYYDIPIFVDGLFRQRHAVEIRRLTLETADSRAVRVACRIEARLFRPVEIPSEPLRDTIDAAELGASQRGFATTALAHAAQLEAWERFLTERPGLLERSQANRRLVMRTIPRLVRKLPSSPMDWVGATFEAGEAKLAME